MNVHVIPGRGFDSNVYLITGDVPTIIDAGLGLNHTYILNQIRKYIDPKEIEQIILTHEHIDHCRGVKELREEIKRDAYTLAHEYAAEKLEKEGDRISEFFGVFMPSIKIDKRLKDGDRVIIGDTEFQIIHTPGHTPGSICIYNEKEKILFSGDTVFSDGGFGRYDFPGGNAKELLRSIRRLVQLEVRELYPGHGDIVIGGGREHIRLALKNLELLV